MNKASAPLGRFGAGAQATLERGGGKASRVARVLAVDDEATARAVIEDTLSREGYAVRTAATYQEWEQVWASGPAPDVIILDINLAERRGGYEILRAVRKQDKSLPVVILSARNTAADAVFARANGASAFVSKVEGEFDHATRGLVATVRQLMSSR